jgi:hypothetical protein
VFERAGGCCEYCRQSQIDSPFPYHIEHIISEKHGGATDEGNLCLSCPDCNYRKGSDIGSVDSVTGTYTALFNPRIHAWNDHFALDTDTALLRPLTSEARVTVTLLRLNGVEQKEARLILIRLGRFPC